nr:hypothetical protein [Mycobacterium tuberculosis]
MLAVELSSFQLHWAPSCCGSPRPGAVLAVELSSFQLHWAPSCCGSPRPGAVLAFIHLDQV